MYQFVSIFSLLYIYSALKGNTLHAYSRACGQRISPDAANRSRIMRAENFASFGQAFSHHAGKGFRIRGQGPRPMEMIF